MVSEQNPDPPPDMRIGGGGGCNGRGGDGGGGVGKSMTHPVLPAAGSDGGRRGGMRCIACGGRGGGQRVS